MSPINGVSQVRRMPRLGKIRLGIKKISPKTNNPYPVATDYFVVPDEIKTYVGERPKKLNIMFPVEDPREFAIQWLRCYSFSQGLICRGDGVMCQRKVDVESGAIANHTTTKWEWKDGLLCNPETCPEYIGDKPQCRRVMNLLILMPDVPGFGVWQLDTSSFYSIVNINSCVDLIKRLCGRISFIPLTLSLEPQIVEPPGIKKKTVHILQIRSDVKLAEIQRLARKRRETMLLPELDEEDIPTDLYPEDILAEAEGIYNKQQPFGEDETRHQPFEGDVAPSVPFPSPSIEMDTFIIDPQWLKDSLNSIHWNEVTAQSWVIAHFHIKEAKDNLWDLIQTLTRDQAQEFVNEISRRLEKQQSMF